jgi:hypothetical protein
MAEYKKLPLGTNGELLIDETPTIQSPDSLVITSFPKHGKTLSMTNIPGMLIGDCDPDKGTRYFQANNVTNLLTYDGTEEFIKIKSGAYIPAGIHQTVIELYKANQMKEYWSLRNKLESRIPIDEKQIIFKDLLAHINGIPFPVFVIDTTTSLQEMNWGATLAEYNTRFPGKPKDNIKSVDSYGGSQYIRANFIGLKEFIEQNSAPFKIFTGHIKERKAILMKGQEEVSVADMALEGQLSTIFTNKAHAVAIFYRNKKGCFLDFTKKDEGDSGSRPSHLGNKIIKIAETLEEGQQYPITHWDEIFPEITRLKK